MKKIVLLIVLGIAAYVGYGAYSRQQAENPETIGTPVYAEFRVGWRGNGREIDMALFGEMASQDDCQLRSAKVWDDVIAHISVVTHPAYRGRGYGRGVVAHLAATALQAGLIPQYRTLDSNTGSIRIAEALGFERYATSVAVRLRVSSGHESVTD